MYFIYYLLKTKMTKFKNIKDYNLQINIINIKFLKYLYFLI